MRSRLGVRHADLSLPQQLPHDSGGDLELGYEDLSGITRHRARAFDNPASHDLGGVGAQRGILPRDVCAEGDEKFSQVHKGLAEIKEDKRFHGGNPPDRSRPRAQKPEAPRASYTRAAPFPRPARRSPDRTLSSSR